MVDTAARRRLAPLLRHFATGLLTVDEWEQHSEHLAFESRDLALAAVRWHVWFLYCDFQTERLRGRWALTPEGRREVARWLLFLYSNEEYRWPDPWDTGPAGCLLNVLTLGGWGRWTKSPERRHLEALSEPDCWPFLTREELDAARARPPFLRGMTSSPTLLSHPAASESAAADLSGRARRIAGAFDRRLGPPPAPQGMPCVESRYPVRATVDRL